MSATKLFPLIFSMSYNSLTACCIEKEAFLTQDATDLAARGVTPKMITDLEAERIAFVAIPPNVVGRNASSIGFTARNVQIKVLKKSINIVLGIANNTFAKNSSELKSFNVRALSRMNANELINICPNIILKSTEYITKMTVKGLKPAMLTDITTEAAALLPLTSATPTLVGNAESTTIIRRNAANSLFTTLKGLCQTGHAFYTAADNKLKAENYVIYDTDSKVVDREGTVKPQITTSRKTDGITATTPIRMKVSVGTGLQFYYGMTKTSAPTVHAVTVANNPNIFVEKTAEELGYSHEGGIIYLVIHNPNTDDAKFLVKIG